MIAAARVVAAALVALIVRPGFAAPGVPPPALILPGALEPSDGEHAAMPLAQLIADLTPTHEPAPIEEPDPDAVARATRKYIEGRAALAEDKALVAVQALSEALTADPASRAIRAQLARAYVRSGNQQAAAQLYEELLREAPDIPEALLTLGWARRHDDPDATIRYLGALLQLDPSARGAFFGQLPPGSEARVELVLSQALRQVNADVATIELLTRTMTRDEHEMSPRVRAEARRALGDAQARRGDLTAALTTWRSDGKADDDVDAATLEPRITWALVASGREGEALGRLQSRLTGITPNEVDVALAAWLGEAVHDQAALARWGSELAAANATGETARLAAALRGRPNTTAPSSSDRRAMRDEFARRVRGGDVGSAARLAAELMARDSLANDRIIAALLNSGADAPQLMAAAQTLGADGAALHARLALALNDFGGAWRAATDGLAARPNDSALLAAAIEAAGRLGEPGFVEDLGNRATAKDPLLLLALARAWRECDEPERAAALARRAAELAAGAEPPNRAVESAALVALAQAQGTSAASAAERRRTLALDAVASARSAVASDPSSESARRLLMRLLEAVGACDSAECEAARKEAEKVGNDALEILPGSGLAREVAIARRLRDGDPIDLIHAAIAFSAANPSDPDLLELAVLSLRRVNRPDAAAALLDERIAVYPADPLAWRWWTEMMMAAGQVDQAIDRISARAEPPTSDPIALPLKELALRHAGRTAEADAAAAARLATLPASPRRDLERAAQALARGDHAGAVRGLDSAAVAVAQLPIREVLGAAEIAFRLRDVDDRARLVRAFANHLLDEAKTKAVDAAIIARAAALIALESDATADDGAELRRMIDVAIGSTKGRVGAGEVPVWLAIGQSFADRGRAADGAAFLAALLRSETVIDSAAAARIATACFALDAAGDEGVDRSIALLDLVRARGVRPFARDDRVEATDSDALLALSNLYSLVGNRSGSLAILRESLKRDPRHAMSANNLAWDALERGDVDAETARLAEMALSLQPDDKAILDSVGWLRYLQGRITEDGGALALLRRAVQAGGDEPDPDPVDHLGDALWRSGDRIAALALWRQVVDAIERKFPKAQMVRTFATYERREHGVNVADTDSFWERNYGATLERAKKKVERAERGEDPPVAPLASQ